MNQRICKCCEDELPLEQFRMQSGYRIWTCNMCINRRNRVAEEARKHQRFNALLRWPVPDLCAVEGHGTG